MNDLVVTEDGELIPRQDVTTEMVSARQTAETQAAMTVAKRFPRDETQALTKILEACRRPRLASSSMYNYPRGGQMVTGPSIRLAETMARCWGNIDFGIVELEQRHGESVVMAFAHDLETNVRQTKIFSVPHVRDTKRGKQTLTDGRDIYEMVANQGARRLRACILGVIPQDIQDEAVEECEKTLAGKSSVPLIDRIRKMADTFQSQFNVSPRMIEQRLGHKIDATSEHELIDLIKVYNSMKDGMSKPSDWFDQGTEASEDVSERLKVEKKPAAKATAKKTEDPPEDVKDKINEDLF